MADCWNCHVRLIEHANTEGTGAPEHNDLTFCASCGSFGIFELYQSGGAIKLKVRKPTKKEFAEISADHRCTMMLHQWSEWNRQQRAVN